MSNENEKTGNQAEENQADKGKGKGKGDPALPGPGDNPDFPTGNVDPINPNQQK